jgi:hypothetical protein
MFYSSYNRARVSYKKAVISDRRERRSRGTLGKSLDSPLSNFRKKVDRLVFPRLLSREQAAAYCGVSVPTFVSICPIKAVALGHGKRLERFDRISLDQWIDSLGSREPTSHEDWLDKWDQGDDRGSRQGT